MEGTIGEVRIFAGNFSPMNWAFCQGQMLPIQQNPALFSILGTTYGGNGTTNFALPDLRGRVVIGAGTGPGLSQYNPGQTGGVENNVLSVNQLPPHSHPASGSVTPGAYTGGKPQTNDPTKMYPSVANENIYGQPANAQMGQSPVTVSVENTGNGQSVPNIQPYNTLNYIICIEGMFPTRN